MNTHIASMLVAAALLSGCGGISPGDYLIYRIAFEDTERAPDCYGEGQMPVDEQDDSSSLYTPGTFILYVGVDDAYYLDTGPVTLRGSDTGGQEFAFSGSSTDVEIAGNAIAPTRTTIMTETDVTFIVDGKVVDGVFTQSTSSSCSGPDCPDPAESSCTESTPFVGGEIADVELQHEV